MHQGKDGLAFVEAFLEKIDLGGATNSGGSDPSFANKHR
jgi:hypothetical protein